MVINKNIVSYLVSDNASLYDALRKIDRNKHRIVYLVDENNYLLSSCLVPQSYGWGLL